MNKFKNILISKYFIFILINLLTLVFIVFPFFTSNNLLTIDLPGHVLAISFEKEYLLPDIQGWNPFQSLGFPQGTFYPPLMQSILALVSKIAFTPEFWIKFSFGLTLILLPYCIYYFIKKLEKEIFESENEKIILIVTLLTYLLFILLPSTFGGTIKAFTQVGLIYNLYTLPLLYLYLGMLVSMFNNKVKWWYLLLTSLLLSTLILSHLVSGLVTVLLLLIIVIYKIVSKRSFRIQELYVGILSLITTSFFLIPYVQLNRYLTGSKILPTPFLSGLGGISIVLLGIIFLYLFNRYITKLKINRNILIIFLVFIFLISIFPAIDALTFRFADQLNFKLIHPYRLLPFIFYIGLPILGLLVFQIFMKLLKNRTNILNLILVLVLIFFSLVIVKRDLGLISVGKIDPNIYSSYLGSNITNAYLRENIWDYSRVAYTNPIIGKWNNFSLIAQFEESSYLNHYALSLKKSIDPSIDIYPVNNPIYIEDLTLNTNKKELIYDLFNITGAFVLNENDLNICKNITKLQDITTRYFDNGSIKVRDDTLSFCKFDENTYGDVNVYNSNAGFRMIESQDWDKEVKNWWLDSKKEILIEGSENNKELVGSMDNSLDKLQIEPQRIKWDKDFQSFNVSLPEDKDRLAIIKVQYNPRWKAYKLNNGVKEYINVNRVSPSLISVTSSGKLYFEYQFNTFENLLKFISLFSLILIIILIPIFKVKNK